MDMSEILAELDDHGFADTSTVRKVAKVNDAYWDVSSRENWPFLASGSSTVNTVAGTSSIGLPSRFMRAVSVAYPDGGTSLIYQDYGDMSVLFPSLETTSGTPQYYYFIGNAIHLYPVPDAIYALKVRYTVSPAELISTSVEADILIPMRHHQVLVMGALSALYAMEDDLEQAQLFDAKYEKRIFHMRNDIMDRRIENIESILQVFEPGDEFPDQIIW